MNKFFVTTTILLLLISPAVAGETGMLDLLNLTGPRQVAMGETTTLFDADPFTLEYNPATITRMEAGVLGFSRNTAIQDRATNALAVIFPVKSVSAGIHFRLSGIDDLEGRLGNTAEPDYLFDVNDLSVKAFAALPLNAKISAGISAGWLMQKIDEYQGSSPAFGLGIAYFHTDFLAFHGSVANIGPAYTLLEKESDLPLILRVGAGATKYNTTLVVDYVNIKSGDSHIHVGAEYLLEDIVYLRAGYQTGYDSRDISAGAGFTYKNFRIDYAFVPYQSDLGDSHRFSLTVSL